MLLPFTLTSSPLSPPPSTHSLASSDKAPCIPDTSTFPPPPPGLREKEPCHSPRGPVAPAAQSMSAFPPPMPLGNLLPWVICAPPHCSQGAFMAQLPLSSLGEMGAWKVAPSSQHPPAQISFRPCLIFVTPAGSCASFHSPLHGDPEVPGHVSSWAPAPKGTLGEQSLHP